MLAATCAVQIANSNILHLELLVCACGGYEDRVKADMMLIRLADERE